MSPGTVNTPQHILKEQGKDFGFVFQAATVGLWPFRRGEEERLHEAFRGQEGIRRFGRFFSPPCCLGMIPRDSERGSEGDAGWWVKGESGFFLLFLPNSPATPFLLHSITPPFRDYSWVLVICSLPGSTAAVRGFFGFPFPTTGAGAVFHVLPVLAPFLPPVEGARTGEADLHGEVGFFSLFHGAFCLAADWSIAAKGIHQIRSLRRMVHPIWRGSAPWSRPARNPMGPRIFPRNPTSMMGQCR